MAQPVGYLVGGLVVGGLLYGLSRLFGGGGGGGGGGVGAHPVAPVAPNPHTTDLSTVARAINRLHDYNDISTLAVAERQDGTFAIYVQRGYNVVRECDEILEGFGIDPPIPFVEAGEEARHNMHAEMLAVSEWLAGNHPRPVRIGASRGICAYCDRILVHLGVQRFNVEGNVPTNWANPYWYNARPNPLATVPSKRTKGKDYH